MTEVICYTIYGCPKCQRVLNYLGQKEVNVKEINIMEQPEKADDVINLIGEMMTPVIVYNSNFIVGDNLREIDKVLFS